MKLILKLIACLLLISCGFHAHENNLKNKYIIINDNIEEKVLLNVLKNKILLAGAKIIPAAKNNLALNLTISNLQEEQQLLASGKYGQGQVYIYAICLDVNLNGKVNKLCARRRLSEDYNQKLSNLNAIQEVRLALFQDLVSLILLQLGASK